MRTLSVKDTKAQHDTNFIRIFVEGVIKEFEIDKKQILAIVTDNASNMIKAVEKLNEMAEIMKIQNIEEDTEENSELDLHAICETGVTAFTNFSNIAHMRCTMHTLQLAINDSLKEKHVANFVTNTEYCHCCKNTESGSGGSPSSRQGRHKRSSRKMM